MITILNRKELVTVFNMKQQGVIRELLRNEGIDYYIKIVDQKSPSPFSSGSRAHTATLGENLELSREYIIYVKKDDFERADYILNKNYNTIFG
ncbi:MAG TPA: hypothetical protein IAD10_09720 [Candidatus Fimicola cottocaccae]|nr:hypothetical protein [Candidatus Fimicola cottocaccae]